MAQLEAIGQSFRVLADFFDYFTAVLSQQAAWKLPAT